MSATLPASRRPAPRWVPIRTLSALNRADVLRHLMALDPHDRYLRFGYHASDAQVERYAGQLDFDRDEIFGIFNWKLDLIAMTHLAYLTDATGLARSAEFGVSVAAQARGRRYGSRLFDHAVLHARNRGVDTMIIHALSENTAMLRIARNAGASVERDGADSEARLKLPPESLGSRMEALVEDQVAAIDYSVKSHTQLMNLLGTLLRENMTRSWQHLVTLPERERETEKVD